MACADVKQYPAVTYQSTYSPDPSQVPIIPSCPTYEAMPTYQVILVGIKFLLNKMVTPCIAKCNDTSHASLK